MTTTQDIALSLCDAFNSDDSNYDLMPREAYGVAWVPKDNKATFFLEVNKGERKQKTYRIKVEEL